MNIRGMSKCLFIYYFFSLRKNSNIKHCLTFLLGYVVYVSKWTYIKKNDWSACVCPVLPVITFIFMQSDRPMKVCLPEILEVMSMNRTRPVSKSLYWLVSFQRRSYSTFRIGQSGLPSKCTHVRNR